MHIHTHIHAAPFISSRVVEENLYRIRDFSFDESYLILMTFTFGEEGAVSRQSSSFCLILLITCLNRYGTYSKQRNYMYVTKSEIRDKRICLLSIIFEVASSRDQL